MLFRSVCRILCCNVRGLAGNLSDLTMALSQYDILFCSETLVSDTRLVLELLVPSFGRTVLLCWGKMPQARGMAAYVREWFLRNDGFYGLWCETEPLCVQSLSQP